MIEVGPIALKVASRVEQFAEAVLHGDDMLADRNLAAQLFLEIRRRREVVGMRMGIEQPADAELMLFYEIDDLVCRGKARATRRRITNIERAKGRERVCPYV